MEINDLKKRNQCINKSKNKFESLFKEMLEK